jgi:hypothetical protein
MNLRIYISKATWEMLILFYSRKTFEYEFYAHTRKKSVNQNTIFNISSVLAEHFWSSVLPLATLDFLRIRIVKVYVRSVWFSLCACTVCGTGLYCAIVLENFNFLNLPCIASAIYFAVWWLFGGIMDKYYCMYKTKTYQSIPPLANSRYSSKQTIRVGLVI